MSMDRYNPVIACPSFTLSTTKFSNRVISIASLAISSAKCAENRVTKIDPADAARAFLRLSITNILHPQDSFQQPFAVGGLGLQKLLLC